MAKRNLPSVFLGLIIWLLSDKCITFFFFKRNINKNEPHIVSVENTFIHLLKV